MSYTVTDIPLKKLNTADQTKRKCEHHKSSDGTEFMSYTMIKRKKEEAFLFDYEDFDIIDGREWHHLSKGRIITGRENGGPGTYILGAISEKHYSGAEIQNKYYGDYRKSNIVVI
ncbi:MAG: hypothetical protein Faunusvirus8_30 [Faunusvirus sp.]|jgi:hypothetical protein|uniref:Uncharacterized protein n=1 Tax=Faunusvirus sp. TaxID=2487766 RepID=A0A3G5A0F3_9VIRU|nr:MAG: hypothetical protein Faunusvirus8_30 [Faunusvirus sp.]